MADSTLAVERRGDVVWCALDRPPLNLFEPGLIAALRATFEALARDAAIRAAVVTGRGRAFTAGMDVRVLRGLDAGSARGLIAELCAALDAVHRAPFPVLAAVHGACLGAGFELALACDLRVATANASFGLPEVRVGVPSVIQAAPLRRMIVRAITIDFWGTLLLDGPRSDDRYKLQRLKDFETILAAAGTRASRGALERAYEASAAHLGRIWAARRDVSVQDHVRAIVGGIDRDLPARLHDDVLAALVDAYARPILVVPPMVDDGALDALRKLRDLG